MNFNISKLRLSIAILLTVSTTCFCQGLPQITPQTPNAYAFQKAGEIPVNYNTGYLDYGIDLYEIDLGSVKSRSASNTKTID